MLAPFKNRAKYMLSREVEQSVSTSSMSLLQRTRAFDNRISAIDSKRSSLYDAEFKIGNLQNLMSFHWNRSDGI